MIDMLMKIEALPKSGEDVLCSESGIVIGGCAYNAAITLRNLESAADLCVPVGKGQWILPGLGRGNRGADFHYSPGN